MTTATAEDRFTYTINCVNAKGDDIRAMVDGSTKITRETFKRHVDRSHLKTIEAELGYDSHLRMKNDRHVSYHKGTYCGKPCVFFTWSAIEYVFT